MLITPRRTTLMAGGGASAAIALAISGSVETQLVPYRMKTSGVEPWRLKRASGKGTLVTRIQGPHIASSSFSGGWHTNDVVHYRHQLAWTVDQIDADPHSCPSHLFKSQTWQE
ncbi:hypothetical protein XENOCAPTIV_004712 [Xenoophorus captivus]|uniref:Uncharacterized protein n=1 Tax=Xenoophorus captivus TaxID=1517983 RepID=A0ABV0S5B8_9TELE